MESAFFWKGVIAGFLMAAPLGPMGIICMKRSIAHGKLSGFVTGLGTATIDALYSSVAAFSLALIAGFILNHRIPLQALGIAVLLYIGITTYQEKPAPATLREPRSKNLTEDYLSSCMFTLCNPITILSFIGAFAALNFAQSTSSGVSISLVGGVFLGSTLWWALLSSSVGSIRHALSSKAVIQINKLAGSLVILFALALLVDIIRIVR